MVQDARVTAGEQSFLQSRRRRGEAQRLAPRQGQQVMHRRAAGKGLANRFEQRQILRAGENPAPRRRILVDDALQIGEQIRHPLHFVNDGAAGKLAKEGAGVFLGEGPYIQGLQRQVAMFREQGAAQGGFATLPRPGKGDSRKVLSRLPDSGGNVALNDHAAKSSRISANSNSYLQIADSGGSVSVQPVDPRHWQNHPSLIGPWIAPRDRIHIRCALFTAQ